MRSVARFVLGSDDREPVFGAAEITYRPAGVLHAVDMQAAVNAGSAVVAYAVCGRPVHVWADRPFAPDDAGVHDVCAKAAVKQPPLRHPSLADRRGDG